MCLHAWSLLFSPKAHYKLSTHVHRFVIACTVYHAKHEHWLRLFCQLNPFLRKTFNKTIRWVDLYVTKHKLNHSLTSYIDTVINRASIASWVRLPSKRPPPLNGVPSPNQNPSSLQPKLLHHHSQNELDIRHPASIFNSIQYDVFVILFIEKQKFNMRVS